MGGTVYLTDEKLQVSRGLARDAEARNIFGFNTAIGTDFIAAWENSTAYTYPTVALNMTAVSSNTADTSTISRNWHCKMGWRQIGRASCRERV